MRTYQSDIIDVTEIKTPAIAGNKAKRNTYSQNEEWIRRLTVPMERKRLNTEQVNEETLRIYVELCKLVDNELRKMYRSLMNELQRSFYAGGFHCTLLGILYCIAEGHVQRGYGAQYIYDYDYSYKVLQTCLGSKIKAETLKKGMELEHTLPFPSGDTQRMFHLTSDRSVSVPPYNGKSIVWWDRDGAIRSEMPLDALDNFIINATPPRDTKIWSLPDISKEMLILYLRAWRIIRASLDMGIKWKKASRANIDRILMGVYIHYQCNKRTVDFMSALLKMSESTLRDILPRSSYTQSLNLEEDWHRLRLYMPKEVFGEIVKNFAAYKEKITRENRYTLISALAETEARNFRILFEMVSMASPQQWPEILMEQQKHSDYCNFLRDVLKKTEDNDLRVIVFYEIARVEKMPCEKMKKRMKKEILCQENFNVFQVLVEQGKPLDEALMKQLLELKTPIRKTITLDSVQIKQSKKELEQTVDILSEFMQEEEIAAPPEKTMPVMDAGDMVSAHEDTRLSNKVKTLLMRMLNDNGVPLEAVREIALTEDKLPGTYISDLNKKFYEYVGDQLLLVDENTVKIDDYYVEIAREMIDES